MKKRLFMMIAFVWALMMSAAWCAPAPLTAADFELGGINAVTDDLETALVKGGKLRVDYEKEDYIPPVHMWVFEDVKLYTDLETDKILLLTVDDGNVETARGVRIGATKHKIIKEYGTPKKEIGNGMICFVYRMDDARLIFDVTAGYVEAIMINRMPTASLTLEGE